LVVLLLFICLFLFVVVISERVSRVLLMLADEQREVTKMEAGNIAVAIGMKHVRQSLTRLLHLVLICMLFLRPVLVILLCAPVQQPKKQRRNWLEVTRLPRQMLKHL